MAETIQNIGKGKMRARCRNKKVRAKLAKIHGIEIEGDRVIFPVSFFASVLGMLGSAKRGKSRIDIQIKMEMGE